ncbi:hypothetical protein MTO96_008755 [Rhipicephalus appendiculatus]
MLVSSDKQWKESHSTFVRLFEGTVTTWRVPDSGLRSYFLKNRMLAKRTVVVDAAPEFHLESMAMTLRSAKPTRICASWLHTAFYPVNHAIAKKIRPTLSPCQVFGVLEMEGTDIKSAVWPLTSSVSHNPSTEEIRSMLRIESPMVKRLSGEQLIVGCLVGTFYGGGKDSCDHHGISFILECLRQINVSLNVQLIATFGGVYVETVYDHWDVMFASSRLNAESVLDADIPDTEIIQETFFSRINDDRVVMLSEVVYDSWPIFASTIALLLVVALVLSAIEDRRLPPIQKIAESVTLLLASILATSAPFPSNVSRRAIARVALHFPWFLAILPLSSYFRSELTSKITVKAPGDRIDTLQKLEDALDRHEVAPCATVKHCHGRRAEMERTAPACSLMSKLQAAFKRYDPEGTGEVRYHRLPSLCYETRSHLLRHACTFVQVAKASPRRSECSMNTTGSI